MDNKELTPIVLGNDFDNVADILAGSESFFNGYTPEIACTGVGGAACKESCISGCKDRPKTGGNCDASCKGVCKDGCVDGCKDGCKNGCKEGKK